MQSALPSDASENKTHPEAAPNQQSSLFAPSTAPAHARTTPPAGVTLHSIPPHPRLVASKPPTMLPNRRAPQSLCARLIVFAMQMACLLVGFGAVTHVICWQTVPVGVHEWTDARPAALVAAPPTAFTVRPSDAERADGKLRAKTLRSVRDALQTYGAAVVHNVLSADAADALRADLLAGDEPGVSTRRRLHRRSSDMIISSGRRRHWHLDPFTDRNVSSVMVALGLQRDAATGTARGLLGQLVTPRSSLVEIAAIVVHARARAQNFHPDTHAPPRHATEARCVRMVSCFVALQDITAEMGPLELLPGSHAHKTTPDEYDATSVKVLLPKGAVVLMDSRTIHRGGAHTVRNSSLEFTPCIWRPLIVCLPPFTLTFLSGLQGGPARCVLRDIRRRGL